jgi:hypothetical protein
MTAELLILQLLNIAGIWQASSFLAHAEDRWEKLASIFGLLAFAASTALVISHILGG